MNREVIVIRRMKDSDYTDLVALWSGFPGNTMTGADVEKEFVRFLRKNGEYCFVAMNGDHLAGSVMAGNDRRRGYIYHLAVAESLQGIGAGTKLMEAAESALRQAGIEKAHLFIYKDNPAIEFYRRTGWHVRKDIEVMSKVLIGDRYMGTRKDSE